jgi:hypothetical protein
LRRRFTILSFEWREAADQCAEFKFAQEGEGKVAIVAADHAAFGALGKSIAMG